MRLTQENNEKLFNHFQNTVGWNYINQIKVYWGFLSIGSLIQYQKIHSTLYSEAFCRKMKFLLLIRSNELYSCVFMKIIDHIGCTSYE